MYEAIEFDSDGEVVVIRLNRPNLLNSINGVMRKELKDAFQRAPDEGRAVLLTGAGRAFCAGQDLGDVDQARGVDIQRVLRQEYEPLLKAVVNSAVPVVAAVNGPAAGAGANLALTADLVIAGRSAAFMQAFARIGLVPDAGGTYWLPRLVGLQRAMGMCLLADEIDAATAERWGLVWRVTEDDSLMGEAEALARRLARGPTYALGLAREALRTGLSNTFDAQLALEAEFQERAVDTNDFMEGVAAFLEKRPPRFEGR